MRNHPFAQQKEFGVLRGRILHFLYSSSFLFPPFFVDAQVKSQVKLLQALRGTYLTRVCEDADDERKRRGCCAASRVAGAAPGTRCEAEAHRETCCRAA